MTRGKQLAHRQGLLCVAIADLSASRLIIPQVNAAAVEDCLSLVRQELEAAQTELSERVNSRAAPPGG